MFVSKPPFASIFCVVRNGERTIRRCVESVLSQTEQNFEFVIQDGASTDGTVEILESFNDKRIQLLSEPDSGPEEAFFKALRRCRGEIIGSCLADEELFPNAIEWAKSAFEKHAHAVAVYGESQNMDSDGKDLNIYRPHPEFTPETYLLHEVIPCFGASFFKRAALESAGLHEREWRSGCGEFEFWLRAGLQGDVVYCPGLVNKFTVAPNQRSRRREVHNRMIQSRLKIITQLFNEGVFQEINGLRKEQAFAGVFLWAAQMANESGDHQDAINYINRALPYQPTDRRLAEFAGDCCARGLMLGKEGRWEDALKSYECALHGGGASPDVHFLQAHALIQLGRQEEAKAALEKHLLKNPDDGTARNLLNTL